MAFAASEQTDDRHLLPMALKVLIAGGFGVGKTTRYQPEDVRSAVDLEEPIPVVTCDARQRGSSRDVLVALVEHSLRTLPPPDEQPPNEGA